MKILKNICISVILIIIVTYVGGAILTHLLLIPPKYNTAIIKPSLESTVTPGEEFDLKICAYAPTFAIAQAKVSLPNNAVMIGELSKKSSFYPLRSKHQFYAKVVFLDQEPATDSNFTINISGFCPRLFEKNQTSTIKWPTIVAPTIQPDQQVQIISNIDFPKTQKWSTILILIILPIVAILVLYKIIRHLIRKKQIEQNLPWVVAHKKLIQLQSNTPQYSPQEFFSELTDIMKNYIATIYQIPVNRSTTEEFFNMISSNQVLQKNKANLLAEIFALGDLIKFAKHHSQNTDNYNLINLAKEFIDSTSKEITSPEPNDHA
ncbi:MAG: hypothetical protein ACRC37_07890 [Lentisphaeria bacterium]